MFKMKSWVVILKSIMWFVSIIINKRYKNNKMINIWIKLVIILICKLTMMIPRRLEICKRKWFKLELMGTQYDHLLGAISMICLNRIVVWKVVMMLIRPIIIIKVIWVRMVTLICVSNHLILGPILAINKKIKLRKIGTWFKKTISPLKTWWLTFPLPLEESKHL